MTELIIISFRASETNAAYTLVKVITLYYLVMRANIILGYTIIKQH